MLLFFQLLARLPLPLVHFLGATLGVLGLLRPRHRRVIADNLRHAGLYSPGLLIRTSIAWGKGMTELAPIWLRPLEEVTGWVREVRGWEHVEAARQAGKGLIVLGPHLGCLELAGLYLAARMPITALYSRPRQVWVHTMMQSGRNRGQAHMVEPNLGGVRALLTALKRNEAAWVLPDQKANKGEGAWAPLFGRWAYMPTLLYRLAGARQAQPLLFCCERLAWGRGYRLIIEPLPELPAETGAAMRIVNRALEASVRRLPEQYLWSYRLHRLFPGESPPEGPPR
ncbi:MAG: lipid A biosynthesis lauroyl acyltransferase [Pseudomonadota bacterium]|nr:lipid A biosynthesis lauroyl acyltransferase [Pseudomonadota bacterium]